ncbi:MAG TPA: amino acid adenylation domain-containing protein, partial [Blastocatellia bacterium]|nr:amino acid adenylation domain-containing protein [Blastocatellia bacterium]
SPDATAVVYENQQLSYAQLDKRAGQLASRLLRLGAGPDTIVGVCLHRSVDLPVGLIGILKAGASYLPLDPEYPPDRLRFMLGDADVAVVLSDSSLIDSLPGGPAHVITPEAPSAVYRECPRGPAVKDNLAYVMYTSGSTGAPKAAMNSHGAIVNRLSWMQNQYRLSADDRVLQKTPFSFDVSVWEFFWPLLNGVCLVIAEPGGHRDRQYLFDLIKCEQITTLHFVPSMLRVMLEDNSLRRCYSLRQVFCSGEELPVDLRDRFLSTASAGLHNLYGPTEAAVDATFSACQSGNNLWRVPIGRPVANTSIRLLDRSLNVAAIGIAGELHIGGAQVGRGYLGRPDLTAERFTPDPLPELPGARLYKTGDIARYLSDGQLEFLGRVDYQVKIRGHRIELQEIENALKQHSDVREAAVVVRQETGNQKRLVAYVVASPQTDRAELRTFAAERLPGYMVPSAFLLMNALPLTVSGKLDRRALPAPEDTNEVSAKKYEPPSNSPEQVLCRIWSEVLRLKRVGVHDNFFALGGDSIISIQIIDRANREGLRLTPRQLFKHQTVAELAAVAGTVTTFQEQGPVVGDVSLTPIQKRFFESLPLNPNHYNQAVLLKTKQRLDPLLLGQAVSILVEHHDALRLRFIQDRVGWRQFSVGVSEAPVGSVPSVDLSGVPSPEQAAQMARCAGALHESLDLRAGPGVRAAHFSLGDGGFDRFLLIVHHLAVDGVSWRILLQDLGSIYGRLLQGTAISLPAKTTSYKRWSEELSGLANSSRLFGELDYWTADGRTDFGRLPLDDTSGPNSLAAARSVSFQLSEANTKSLLSLLPGKYRATLSDALAAALAAALSAWTGSNRVLIDFEGHGREELLGSADLSRTVGWFTSIFPVLLLVPDSQDPTDLIKSIKEQLRSVPNWGAGYAALRYLSREPSVSGRLARASENETILNYLGQFDQALGGSDLFEFAEEPSGLAQNINEKREYLLEVTGFVNNDRLNVSVTYCSNLHRKETIQRLSAAIESRLDRLAERCLTAPSAFTPSDFPLISLNQHRLDQLASRFRDIEDLYPTSPLQQGLLFHVLYSTAADLYLNQLSYWIQGALDTSAFKEAWSRVSSRHAIWRTAFVWEDLEQPLQVVLKAAALGFEELDWRGMPSEEQERSFELLLNKDRLLPFDLMKPPLARLTLVRLSHDAFQFVWTHHHLISDGWSAVILLKDILLCYEALRVGKEPVLPRPRPYRDYIAWPG